MTNELRIEKTCLTEELQKDLEIHNKAVADGGEKVKDILISPVAPFKEL